MVLHKMNDTSIPNQQTQILISVNVGQVVSHVFVSSSFNGHSCNREYTLNDGITVVNDNLVKIRQEAVLS
jgi:hypothetical protein